MTIGQISCRFDIQFDFWSFLIPATFLRLFDTTGLLAMKSYLYFYQYTPYILLIKPAGLTRCPGRSHGI